MSSNCPEHDLLTRIDGIGPEMADRLLARFGSGREVASRASSGWGALTDVDGISEEAARSLFDRMRDAGVYEDLRDRRYSDANDELEQTTLSDLAEGHDQLEGDA